MPPEGYNRRDHSLDAYRQVMGPPGAKLVDWTDQELITSAMTDQQVKDAEMKAAQSENYETAALYRDELKRREQ